MGGCPELGTMAPRIAGAVEPAVAAADIRRIMELHVGISEETSYRLLLHSKGSLAKALQMASNALNDKTRWQRLGQDEQAQERSRDGHPEPDFTAFTTVDGILEVVRASRDNAALVAKGFDAIHSLCLRNGNKPVLIQMGGIRVIVEAMRAWKGRLDVQQKRIAEGGCSMVAMESMRTILSLHKSCLRAIGTITRNNIKHSQEIADNGGVKIILSMMRLVCSERLAYENKWTALMPRVTQQEKACEHLMAHYFELGHDRHDCLCCKELRSMRNQNDPQTEEIDAVARTAELLGKIQEQALRALTHLACNANTQKTIQQAGGVSTVLEAMRACPMSAGVQEHGCGVLCSLSSVSEHRAQVHLILQALQTHVMHQGVQEQGRNALVCLAMSSRNDPRTRAALHEAGFA